MTAIEVLLRLWVAALAVTAGLVAVGLLRRPWRRAFGAGQACRLWWLPLFAVIASQLPHFPNAARSSPVWFSVHWQNVPAAPAVATVASLIPVWLLGVWLAGAGLVLGWETLRQLRFRRGLKGVSRRPSECGGVTMMWLSGTGQGPALVGCWRPCILLPADFESRYDAEERELILAHERMHACRHDLKGLLLAMCLRAVFWFHPLAWWAVQCLRQDQELACDAELLRTHATTPRRYADALLKTQLSSLRPAPLQCAWHTHPVKERITMLKLASPGRVRRVTGILLAVLLGTGLVGVVYANTAEPGQAGADVAGGKAGAEYQLSMSLRINNRQAVGKHSTRADLSLCLRPPQHARVFVHDVHVGARVKPLPNHHVRLGIDIMRKGMDKPRHFHLEGLLGRPIHMELENDGKNGQAGTRRIVLDVTPIAGCPARTSVSQEMHEVSVRDAAMTVAARSGFMLDNPQALSTRKVSFNFEDMSGSRAMKLLARIDGKRAVIQGNHVRIEAR